MLGTAIALSAAVTADGLTPLHFAALGPSADCISALLDGAAQHKHH